jgi:hypothetical protein
MQCVNNEQEENGDRKTKTNQETETETETGKRRHYFFLPQIDLALDRPATLGSFESFSLPD